MRRTRAPRQPSAAPARPCIVRADNDQLFDDEGHTYIDLFSGHGAAWLGHAHPRIAARVAAQFGAAWITGGLDTPVYREAARRVERYFPPSHRLAALYSTGMEAAEFALRVARVATGRTGAAGFERSMHGKSLATAFLGWDNRDGVALPGFARLPFPPGCDEQTALARLAEALATGAIAALFVEPVQGCGGGHSASPEFHREAARLCAARGAVLVFDEILTGFYRTGPAFAFEGLGVMPDVVLLGKALGNGFPVSAVVVHERLAPRPEMLPGSTFSGNPLAAAAVVGTLREMAALDLPARVAAIEAAVHAGLAPVQRFGVSLRGRGALWALELPAGVDMPGLVADVYRSGVAVGYAGRFVRVLPAATIRPQCLETACSRLREAVSRACHGQRSHKPDDAEAPVRPLQRFR